MKFFDFLASKIERPGLIDTARMPRIWERIAPVFGPIPEVVHIVGTNGKGTTGRFLASMLRRAGRRVGHYTSPHILAFNERIWIDGAEADGRMLDEAHARLQGMLASQESEELSYFEYTTLLAMGLFAGRCDLVVLEAGLGGEFDATAVFPGKRLLLVTPVDWDHCDLLGETIAEIAATKLRAMRSETILGIQPHAEVAAIAQTIGTERSFPVGDARAIVTDREYEAISGWIALRGYPAFLGENLTLAAAALIRLGIPFSTALLEGMSLRGRMERVFPNVTVDVGHNPLAARAAARLYEGQKIELIYNCYADKDAAAILAILAPVVSRVLILPVDHERIMPRADLEAAIGGAGLAFAPYAGIDPDTEYLVFGSFSVAEAFLKDERRAG